MEQLEAAVTDREKLRARMTRVDDDLVTTTAERDRQLAALDGEVDGLRAERAGLTPLIPADLLALYDRIGATTAVLARLSCDGGAAPAVSWRSTRLTCGRFPPRPRTKCCVVKNAAAS
jgi:hypothetical protein